MGQSWILSADGKVIRIYPSFELITKINIGGHAGLETIYGVMKTSDLVRVDNVVVKNHAYQYQVRVPQDKLNSETVQAFVNSFKLTSK